MAANLVTKAEYKAYAGIKSDNQDAEIDSLIPKVSQLVKTYCGRAFVDWVDEPKVEVFSGGFEKYAVKEYPVISILSMETSEDYGKTYTSMVEFEDYALDLQDDTLVALATDGFVQKTNGYKVSYFAGYETLPQDLKLVVFDLITYYIKNDAVSHQQKTNVSGALQLEYLNSSQFPAHIARVLNLYKASWD